MTVGIMQPYFLPYIGYFQLINKVDKFVIYDDIEYTKKGWINRNRILMNGQPEYISIPLKKDKDHLNVNQRFLADSWPKDKVKLLNKIKSVYRKAPNFEVVLPLFENIANFQGLNLFDFVFNSVIEVCGYLKIGTDIIVSSTLEINNELRGQERVIATCKSIGATVYTNPIGGVDMYDGEVFLKEDIQLSFIKANNIIYPQIRTVNHVASLSILDVIMHNSVSDTRRLLTKFEQQ